MVDYPFLNDPVEGLHFCSEGKHDDKEECIRHWIEDGNKEVVEPILDAGEDVFAPTCEKIPHDNVLLLPLEEHQTSLTSHIRYTQVLNVMMVARLFPVESLLFDVRQTK